MPVRAAGIRYGRGDEAEVAPGIVHANVERISIVVRVVFDARFARFENLPVGIGLLRRNVTRFRGGVAAREQEDVGVAERLVSLNLEFLIGLFVDERVRRGRSGSVAIQPVLALRDSVFLRVEDGLIVGGPYDRTDTLSVIG